MADKPDIKAWFTLIGAFLGLVAFIIVMATNAKVMGAIKKVTVKAGGA